MKRYMGLLAFTLLLMGIGVATGLPTWAFLFILGLVACGMLPGTRRILFLVLSCPPIVTAPLLPFAALGVHVYTVVVAWQDVWWKGLVSLFLPVISEVYWFVVFAIEGHGIKNAYCLTVLVLVAVSVYTYVIGPLFLSAASASPTE